MQVSTQDYLKKALLDTQEKVRDFMLYSERIDDDEISDFFRACAEEEGYQAQQLQEFIKIMQ